MDIKKDNCFNETIDKFTNDKGWNTAYSDGTHRFDKGIEWIKQKVTEYAEAFNVTKDEMMYMMEKERNYSWPNYYQEANFPKIDANDDMFLGVFETKEDFFGKYSSFKCPSCGTVSKNPQECKHRTLGDGECDWCSYGLFASPHKVIVKDFGFKAMPIFEPVEE